MDRPGLGVPMGSLNLPSSMDIARYLEQVQEVEPASPSPRGCVSVGPLCSRLTLQCTILLVVFCGLGVGSC